MADTSGQAGLYNEALASSSKYVVEEGGSVVKDGEGAVLRFDSVELTPEGRSNQGLNLTEKLHIDRAFL